MLDSYQLTTCAMCAGMLLCECHKRKWMEIDQKEHLNYHSNSVTYYLPALVVQKLDRNDHPELSEYRHQSSPPPHHKLDCLQALRLQYSLFDRKQHSLLLRVVEE